MSAESVKLGMEIAKVSIELAKLLFEVGSEAAAAYMEHRRLRKRESQNRKAQEEYEGALAGLQRVRVRYNAQAKGAPTLQVVAVESGADGAPVLAKGEEGEFFDALHGVMDLRAVGLYQEGIFVDGELEGFGKMRTARSEYEGCFQHGRPHGEGRIVYVRDNGERSSTYVGQFADGLRDGFGQLTTAGGTLYAGRFDASGGGAFVEGSVTTGTRGIRLTGEFRGWQPLRERCTLEYPSGLVFRGPIDEKWRWHGAAGRLEYPRQNAETGKPFSPAFYEGEFVEARFEGQGTMGWYNGHRWQGQWLRNELVKDAGVWSKWDADQFSCPTPAMREGLAGHGQAGLSGVADVASS